MVGLSKSQFYSKGKLTFGIVAGLKHMQLMWVVGKGEHFDH